MRHRYLWPLLRARLLPLALLAFFIVGLTFAALFIPQAALLFLFHGRDSAWVNATFLCLSEANLIVAIIFEAFFVDDAQLNVFDSILIARGHAELVKKTRALDEEESDPVKCLGKRDKGGTFAPFSLRQIVEFIILLPLNFVPFVGVILFLLATGYRAGPLLQWRYHKLKGMNKRDRKAFVKSKSRRWQYMWFGTAALALQLVPVLSLFFLMTTAAGSALWAADMEDAEQDAEHDVDQDADHGPDGAPPPYSDEP